MKSNNTTAYPLAFDLDVDQNGLSKIARTLDAATKNEMGSGKIGLFYRLEEAGHRRCEPRPACAYAAQIRPVDVATAKAALIAAGGSIEHGVIECPSPEAALTGIEYLAAVHRDRREQAEADRVISQFLAEAAEAR